MATIHPILRKKTNTQGLHPIVICVTQNRKRTLLHTGQYILEKYWDINRRVVKKSHPNSQRLNNLIAAKESEVNDQVLECINSFGDDFSIEDFKSFKKKISTSNSFFAFAESYFKQLEDSRKYTRINSEKPLLKKIKKLNNDNEILFNQITVPFLRKLTAKLKKDGSVNDRSIANVLMFIRNLYNRAIDENLANKNSYPFGNGKGKIRIKIPESVKVGLSRLEIEKIEDLELTLLNHLDHARNIWLFSYYLAGMRIADVLKIKWTDIRDGRLYYRMGKNNKVLSLKIIDKAQAILDKYKPSNEKIIYVFPELEGVDPKDIKLVLLKIRNANHKLNKNLKKIAVICEINKSLSMHIARHSFGNIASDQIHPKKLQKLYRHSNLKTTINYQANFIHQDVDDALEQVLNS